MKNKIPCENCITLSICLGVFSKYKSPLRNIVNLMNRCSILRKHLRHSSIFNNSKRPNDADEIIKFYNKKKGLEIYIPNGEEQ